MRLTLSTLALLALTASADASCRKFCSLDETPVDARRSTRTAPVERPWALEPRHVRGGTISRDAVARDIGHLNARDLCLRLTGDVKCNPKR